MLEIVIEKRLAIMPTVYQLKASEIGSQLWEEITAIFGDKEIEIAISEFDETEQ